MTQESHSLIPHILHLLMGGILGLVSASLAQQWGWRSAERMPGESRWPHCLYCLAPLSWQSIVPLFGWLLRPGRFSLPCPCGQRRGLWTQPAAEAAGFLLGVTGMSIAGWSGMAWPLCLGLGILPAIALIDLYYGIIPDELSLMVAVFGLLWIELSGSNFYLALMTSGALLLVGLFCVLVYSRWRKQDMLGLGDVKFFAAAGLWLEPAMAPWFLALGGFTGVGIGLIWQRLGGGKEFPFAPALCVSLAVCVLYQITGMP